MKLICFFMCIFTASAAVAQSSSSETQPMEVPVDSIGKSVTLIGRLGKPLGTMLKMRGHWAYPDQSNGPLKDDSLRFYITHVDGKELKPSVVVGYGDIYVFEGVGKSIVPEYAKLRELEGQVWDLNGYEAGEFRNTPAEFWRALGSGPQAEVWHPPFVTQVYAAIERQAQLNQTQAKARKAGLPSGKQ